MLLRAARRQPWICPRCLNHQPRLAKCGLITSAATSTTTALPQVLPPISLANPSIAHDDRTLRHIFDSPSFWRDFSSSTSTSQHPDSTKSNTGLFQNRYLTRPEGFAEYAHITLQKCKTIVAEVLAYSSINEYKLVARQLDRLSDLLCRVIDLSDFVRAVHPDARVQAAASSAYAAMFEYMNVLNTTTGLNEQLKRAAGMREVWASWSEEERTVAAILIRDFSKSAIDLAEKERTAFVHISNEIAEVGNDFVETMAAETPTLSLKSSRLKGMDPVLVRQLTKWGTVTLPTTGVPATLALRTVEDAETRREIYMANRTASRASIHRLEVLLKKRAKLAQLSGYESYAHMTLSDKMAQTPEAVSSFLSALAADNRPTVGAELAQLLALKKADPRVAVAATNHSSTAHLNPWDRDYYTTRLLSSFRSKMRAPDMLSAYFSLGTVLQGLSRLFHRLYGLRLVPRPTQLGETWHPDVRRLDVVDDLDGHVAVLYCDLFARNGKSPNPAHFTLRCSRRIDEQELREATSSHYASDSSSPLFASPEEAANDGLATARNPRDGHALYQLPTIALICDFALPSPSPSSLSSRQTPTLLTLHELTTLFHEMGHAVHSICGRTALQNVSGTRCATDFAELPSVLMESFASDPEVLALYARHWQTDAPLDVGRVSERVREEGRLQRGGEIEGQILLGVLDQRLHSSLPLSWDVNQGGGAIGGAVGRSTEVFRRVWREFSSSSSSSLDDGCADVAGEPDGTAWQGFFGHLFGYGGVYYAYLFDRAIAGKIWREVFQRPRQGGLGVGGGGGSGGAVCAEAGALFREEVLRHGGARDGWKCVAGALGEREGGVLAGGGSEAMREVGRWGVRD